MKRIVLLAVSGILLWGCNHSSDHAGHNHETATKNEHQHEESAEVIQLNNGDKWIVNEEMKPFVLKGSELVDTYMQNSQTDYKELAKEVKAQNEQLIKSCTMDGKSHEELHKWLHPHLQLVEKLEKVSGPEKANEIVLQLQNSYKEYHNYFN